MRMKSVTHIQIEQIRLNDFYCLALEYLIKDLSLIKTEIK